MLVDGRLLRCVIRAKAEEAEKKAKLREVVAPLRVLKADRGTRSA
jgi:hypothetical protein